MNHAKGIVIWSVHESECSAKKRLRERSPKAKCSCPRYIKWRIWANGKAEPPEERYFGRFSAAQLDYVETELKKRRGEIRRGESSQPQQQIRLLFLRACEIFYELHAKHLRSHKDYLRHFQVFAAFWKDRYLDEITYEDVENYRERREKIVSPATVNKEHMVITCLYNCFRRWRGRRDPAFMKLVENKMVRLPEENPGSLVKKKSELNRRRTRVLDFDEYRALMDAAPENLRWVYMFAVGTMLRKKDLELLTPESFDKYARVLKGVQSKTNHSFESPLSSDLIGYIERRIGDMTTWGMNGFYGKSRDKLLDFANFQKEHWATVEKTGIKEFEFRDLRRTGATWLYRAGIPLDVISQLLGHSSVQMTERYIGVDKKRKESAVRMMSNILQKALALPAPAVPTEIVVQAETAPDNFELNGYNTSSKVSS